MEEPTYDSNALVNFVKSAYEKQERTGDGYGSDEDIDSFPTGIERTVANLEELDDVNELEDEDEVAESSAKSKNKKTNISCMVPLEQLGKATRQLVKRFINIHSEYTQNITLTVNDRSPGSPQRGLRSRAAPPRPFESRAPGAR